MDKKNTIIGVLLLAAALACFVISSRYAPQPPPKPVASTSPVGKNEAPAPGPAHTGGDAVLSAGPAPKNATPAEFVTLSNDAIAVKFTNAGGAIDTIALQQHAAHMNSRRELSKERYTINSTQAAPALGFVDLPGLDKDARYEVVSRSDDEITYRTVAFDGTVEVTRHFKLLGAGNGDPYQIRHETIFRNLTAKPVILPAARVNLGTIAPLSETDSGLYLNVGYHNDDGTNFIRRDELAGGGFFTKSPPLPFLDKPAPVVWASVKNQFFTTILTPDQPGTGVRVERVKTNLIASDEDRSAYGVTADAQFNLQAIPASGSTTWGATYFAGPKEYKRLSNSANFKHAEEKVMQFDSFFLNKIFFSGFFAPLLLTIMTWVHTWIPNWGWAVVLTTILLKVVTLPFTLAASRSSKRMQKLMPVMNEIREKYKDSPAKLQEAMMKAYKDNKVNPLGGCIPVLITIPFFMGFFGMLQSAAELRFAPFLWVPDLAAPDTVFSFGTVTLPLLGLTHLTINILPLLMGATMIYQMRLTPTPTTDPAQQTMMKIMPVMYMAFCYNFAAALSLYSTINGLFTIGQQMVINRLPEPELPAATGADGMKNVTPKKKK